MKSNNINIPWPPANMSQSVRSPNKSFVQRAQFGQVKCTKKVRAGLDWLLSLHDGVHDLNAGLLRKNLCQEKTPAGKLLRSCLIEVGSYLVGVKSKSFVVNVDRLIEVRQKYGLDPCIPPVIKTGKQAKKYLLTLHVNPFKKGIPRNEGKRSGNRYYTPLCFMEEEVRTALIEHGFDYDITAAMATILYQKYIAEGGAILSTWHRLVLDRASFRNELVSFTGLSLSRIKTIIASALNGGQLVRYKDQSIWQLFSQGHAKCTWDEFAQHPLMKGLVEEGRILYAKICPTENRVREKAVYKTGAKKGQEYMKTKSRGWHQFSLYEQIEDEVMNVVSLVLGEEANVWYIHDGFVSKERVTREKLLDIIEQVKLETGYQIELEETELDAWTGLA